MSYAVDYCELADATSAYAREHGVSIRQALHECFPKHPNGDYPPERRVVASVLGSRSHKKNRRTPKPLKTRQASSFDSSEVLITENRIQEHVSHPDFIHTHLSDED